MLATLQISRLVRTIGASSGSLPVIGSPQLIRDYGGGSDGASAAEKTPHQAAIRAIADQRARRRRDRRRGKPDRRPQPAPRQFAEPDPQRLLRPDPRVVCRDRQDIRRRIRKKTGVTVEVKQSHGGSGRQATEVIKGQQKADVVSLALPSDMDALRKRGLIACRLAATVCRTIRSRTPRRSSSSSRKTIRMGIHDWPDLIKDDVDIMNPNPRTSGNGKLSVLAAWGSVTTRGGSEQEATDYVRALLSHVKVADSRSARRRHHLLGRENRRRPSDLGERSPAGSGGEQRPIRNRLSAGQHPRRTGGHLGRRESQGQEAGVLRQGVSGVPLHRRRARDCLPSTATGR